MQASNAVGSRRHLLCIVPMQEKRSMRSNSSGVVSL